ncbi:hypothetical protein ABTB18_19680, partial [Acinetobacter baumannii]
ESFNARLEERKPGEKIRLTIFRADDLRTLEVALGAAPEDEYKIVPVTAPSDAQRQIYRAWLGAPFPTESASKVE